VPCFVKWIRVHIIRWRFPFHKKGKGIELGYRQKVGEQGGELVKTV